MRSILERILQRISFSVHSGVLIIDLGWCSARAEWSKNCHNLRYAVSKHPSTPFRVCFLCICKMVSGEGLMGV